MQKMHGQYLLYFCKVCGLANSDGQIVYSHIAKKQCKDEVLDSVCQMGFVAACIFHFQPADPQKYEFLQNNGALAVIVPSECLHRSFLSQSSTDLFFITCTTCKSLTTLNRASDDTNETISILTLIWKSRKDHFLAQSVLPICNIIQHPSPSMSSFINASSSSTCSAQYLPTQEREAVEFFQDHGILPRSMMCRKGHTTKLYFGKSIFWKCTEGNCVRRMRIRSGNWLEGSRIPISAVIRFIYCWCQQLTSIEWCQRELKLSNDATIDWNNRMREVCVSAVQRNKKKIGGDGLTVEIDDNLFNKRRNNDEKPLPEHWIFGGICRETRDMFIEEVPDRSANTFLTFIKKNVEEGSIIYSDFLCSYRIEELNEAGFEQLKVDYRYNFVDPGTNTQCIEKLWETWNKKHRGTARHHFN
ncbi:unnamed protein product, partial [Dracunculus medinensis]|uniref:DDE_Tnp_IS1595 domain-containing protein n=1 Tax=Dracunculus medinensis TaxID=318479 RepID=A0A0N4USA0_DRAME